MTGRSLDFPMQEVCRNPPRGQKPRTLEYGFTHEYSLQRSIGNRVLSSQSPLVPLLTRLRYHAHRGIPLTEGFIVSTRGLSRFPPSHFSATRTHYGGRRFAEELTLRVGSEKEFPLDSRFRESPWNCSLGLENGLSNIPPSVTARLVQDMRTTPRSLPHKRTPMSGPAHIPCGFPVSAGFSLPTSRRFVSYRHLVGSHADYRE